MKHPLFKQDNLDIFMKEVVNKSHTDHFYSSLYNNIFSLKNPLWKYAENLKHLESSILIPYLNEEKFVKMLRIHSHGNKNPPGLYNSKGPVIRMGEDNLSLHNFYENGYPSSHSVRDFLITLKSVMAENSEINFDSCNQGKGEILKNISRFLCKDIKVVGFSGLGVPFIKGNISFKNGMRVD